jgi:nitroreductase
MVTSIELIKSVVPEQGIIFLRKVFLKIKPILSFFDGIILQAAVTSPLFSSFYYALISSEFRRENHAVLCGRLHYYKNSEDSTQDNAYLLRRNIHRLEKGLIMQPRREIFALDYIEETVSVYCKFFQERSHISLLNNELKWFHDVLLNYFSVVDSHPTINRARKDFLSNKLLDSDGQWVPYKRNLNKSPSVNYNQFLELCHRRRSVRWYEQKKVPRELIDQAVIAATLSPSACNRQPFEFRIFDEPSLVQKIASLAGGVQGFVHNFPVVIVVIGQLRAYFSERDRHIIYIDSSLASMSLMFALESLGLSSCPINWPDTTNPERKMQQLLNLDCDERPIMLISVGYPDPEGLVPFSQKKTLDKIRKYN